MYRKNNLGAGKIWKCAVKAATFFFPKYCLSSRFSPKRQKEKEKKNQEKKN